MDQEERIADGEKRKRSLSAIEKIGVAIGGFMLVTLAYERISSGPATADSDSAAISSADQIIQSNLVSPDGYQRRSAAVVWKGSTKTGKPMFGVKVDYNAQNAFGATIRKCEYIFYFRDGENTRWDEKLGREPCDAVRYFNGNEVAMANEMAEVLVEQHY